MEKLGIDSMTTEYTEYTENTKNTKNTKNMEKHGKTVIS